ncbi:hypothetical protein ACQ4PT_027495 [Festuca glaucescens]
MAVLELCDEDGYGDRDGVGDDLGTGREIGAHQQNGVIFHGVDPARPRNGDGNLVDRFLSLHRGEPSRPRNGGPDHIGRFLLMFFHGADPARSRNGDGNLVGQFLFLHGADPKRPRNGDGYLIGGFLLHGADPARPRSGHGNLVGPFLFLHGADPKRPRNGDGYLVGVALLHHQHGDADEVCAASPLRLRGGAADYYLAPVPPPGFTWVEVMGFPIAQTIPGTCALVAGTVCLEAQHRRMFEAVHGPGTFPCRAAAPRKLRRACFREIIWNPCTRRHERVWHPKNGAKMGRILGVMKRLGGARTTNAAPPAPFFLPLEDWEQYSYSDGGLTAKTAARLLYERGPCIGTLFATTQFFRTFVVPNSNTAPAVFRGLQPRGPEDGEEE